MISTAPLQHATTAIGRHVLADFSGASGLDDLKLIEQALRDATSRAGATLLQIDLHQFGTGRGITGVALLAESHISIHTWPELNYAALDIFMCGSADPELALRILEEQFRPTEKRVTLIERHPA